MSKKKVMVGMSGGVDSSVAVALLVEMGYEVIGVTLQILPDFLNEKPENEGGCCSLSAVNDARRVANVLSIPYYVLNFKDIFKKSVVDYFISEYKKGKTPNPCIACNKYVKFDAMLSRAISMDIDFIATGHYAKNEFDNNLNRFLLKKSGAIKKDQTYALYNLTQFQLAHTLFPLFNYTKEQTRELAKKYNLPVANKKDSQEICFVPDNNYSGFIKEYDGFKSKEGHFLDEKGNILGKHKGIINYTIGQRKGLNLSFGEPMYVTKIDYEKNCVVLGREGSQYSNGLFANSLNFIPFDKPNGEIEVSAKIRYSAKEAKARLFVSDDNIATLNFLEPQRAVTPGQSVVFYDGDIVVGGGVILGNL